MNIFSSAENNELLKAIIELQDIPDFRTIHSDLAQMAQEKISRLVKIETFGIQLDHWTNVKRENCLLIAVSTIDEDWKQILQVIELPWFPVQNMMLLWLKYIQFYLKLI